MTHDQHAELRRLFDRALELPAAVRAAFLDSKCGADAGLKQRLLAMLAAAEGELPPATATVVQAPAASPAATQAQAVLAEGPGTRIGPYKLLQLIGEGGFGAVFLAEQQEPVVRKVALKVIKLGMDTRQVVARFEQERQALALMDHPNIARVLDAGATDTGRPYFVMDLVKGDPIAQYCDKNHLTIDERLELFAQVCHAVQHAHGKGIIHRDLKPSNILVGTQDGRPQAKVIDFGIAKATSSKLTDKTLFTEHQQVIGTLQYMSPEQAEGSLDIDTRTDVYSLGVMLYELLTGSTPFDQKTIQDALYGELQRMIREVEPPKPSTRLHQSSDTLASIAAHRRVEPKRLGTIVRGELDWIVMKALEKDRARRYETANGLAQDIARYRGGEAVLAAPPGAGYRVQKFVRRHRGVVVAVGAVALALLLGVLGFAWQASVAGSERNAAVQANQKAAAINQFLLDMLGSADLRAFGRDAKVSQALAKAAGSVGTAFVERPEVEAALRQILAKTYTSIGMLDEAQPQVEAALELNRKVHGEESAEFANSLHTLSGLQLARGEDQAAAATLLRACAIADRTMGPEAQLTLAMRTEYGNALVGCHREAEAEQVLGDVLAVQTRVFGRENSDGQIMVNSLAVLLHRLGRLDEAAALYREALAIGVKVLGAEHPDTLTASMNLGSLLHSQHRDDEAEPILVSTGAAIRRVFGNAHTQTATAALVLGRFFSDRGRYPEAVPLLEEAVAVRGRAEGERSDGVIDAKENLARMLQAMGESDRAVALEREIIAGCVALHGADSKQTLGARQCLASMLAKRPGDPEAEAIYRELLESCPRLLGADDRLTIIVNNSFGVFLMGQERFVDAEPYVRTALEAGRRVVGADDRDTLITQSNFVGILRETGQFEAAESLGRDTIERCTRVFGPNHPNTGHVLANHAKVLVLLGRNDEARAELAAAVAIAKAALGAQNPAFCNPALDLGRLLADTGHAAEAEPILREVAAVIAVARGAKDPRTAKVQVELGHCLGLLGHLAEAEPMLLAAHEALAAARPAGHPDLRRAVACLAGFYRDWNVAAPDAARAALATDWQAQLAALPAVAVPVAVPVVSPAPAGKQ